MSAREDGQRIGANKDINVDQVVSVCGPLLGILKCGWIQAFSICSLSIIFKFPQKNLTIAVREEFFMFVIDYHCLLKINIKEVTDQFMNSFCLLYLLSLVSLGNSKMGQLKFCFIFWQILSHLK